LVGLVRLSLAMLDSNVTKAESNLACRAVRQ
jgi:hypothetical protein